MFEKLKNDSSWFIDIKHNKDSCPVLTRPSVFSSWRMLLFITSAAHQPSGSEMMGLWSPPGLWSSHVCVGWGSPKARCCDTRDTPLPRAGGGWARTSGSVWPGRSCDFSFCTMSENNWSSLTPWQFPCRDCTRTPPAAPPHRAQPPSSWPSHSQKR